MQSANYTSENICAALGMKGFANDLHLAAAEESVRLLLMPSFHPEVCVSFLKHGADVSIRVETAREQIWLQQYPNPQRTLTDTADGTASIEDYFSLIELFELAANPPVGPRFVVIDGMVTHSIHRRAGERIFDIDKNVSAVASYEAFVAKAISVAWEGILDPVVRNAVRDAGTYAGVTMPAQAVPPVKPAVRVMVLGPEAEVPGLLEELERHHKR